MSGVDVTQNVVELAPVTDEIEGATPGTASASDVEAVEAVAAPFGDAVEVGEPVGAPTERACSTSYRLCDPPLRGGVAIYAPRGSGELCTAGFNVRGRRTNRRFVLTAGHCSMYVGTGAMWTTRQPTLGSVHNIGTTLMRRLAPVDAGIVTITNTAGWAPRSVVQVRTSNGPGHMDTARNELYAINAVGNHRSIPGSYLCFTGAVSSTRCGAFRRANVDDGPRQNLGEVNVLSCRGDSGAPFFIANRGFGILQGGPTVTQVRYNQYYGIGPTFPRTDCGTPTWYTGLQSALNTTSTRL